jgi:hypothetical protein
MIPNEVNKIYKKYFKEYFDKSLKLKGFKKRGTTTFCKLNKLGLLEYIGFFKHRQRLRIEYAIIPICCGVLKESIGIGKYTKWVDLEKIEDIENNIKKLLNIIEFEIYPWFSKNEDFDYFFKEYIESSNVYFGEKIYVYIFKASMSAKFHIYDKIQENIEKVREEYNKFSIEVQNHDFFVDTLKEANTLEKRFKQSKKSLEKYIKEVEYNSLLDWKMEKLLKNKAKFSNNRCCKRQWLFFCL